MDNKENILQGDLAASPFVVAEPEWDVGKLYNWSQCPAACQIILFLLQLKCLAIIIEWTDGP